jgi:pimeloyl-ACP methyl ester carboxylesterase
MSNWTEGDVIANGVKLHYYRTGGDRPPVVLAHGITDNGLCWTPLARALENDYDLIMVDARGHGLSSVPEAGYTNADHAADHASVIQALGLDRPPLIGHSMGAIISAFLAAHYPHLTRGIVLEDPPWRARQERTSEQDRIARAEQWRADVIARKQLTFEQLIADGRAQRRNWSEDEFDPWAQAKLQVSPNVLDYVRGTNLYWSEYVPKIQCPVLLVTGDVERDAVVSSAVAQEVITMNPHVHVTHIAGAGHSIRREQFDAYLQAVRNFLGDLYP